MTKKFFQDQTRSTYVKAKIVSDYFPEYCRILFKKHKGNIRFFDWFSGPGVFESGSKSTPVFLVENCIKTIPPDDLSRIGLVFNDGDKHNIEVLEQNVKSALAGFKGQPPETEFYNKCISLDNEKYKKFMKAGLIRSNNPKELVVLFFDPFGYKELDTKLFAEFLAPFGNELFLFINFKRLIASISHPDLVKYCDVIFPKSSRELLDKMKTLSIFERRDLLLKTLFDDFKSFMSGELFTTTMLFCEEGGKGGSHALIHFTKDKKGHELAKKIFDNYRNCDSQYEKYFMFDPKVDTSSSIDIELYRRLKLEWPIESITNYLKMRGEVSVNELITALSKDTNLVRRNYSDTLKYLLREGQLSVRFLDDKNHKSPITDSRECLVTLKSR